MQMQTMETSLSNELLEGEELVWSGRPGVRGKSITSPGRTFWILGLIYAAIGLVMLLTALIFLFAMGNFVEDIGAFAGFLVPGSIFFLLGVIFLIVGQTARFMPKSTFYAITDRRVIILRGGRYLRVISYETRAIHQVQRLERPDGSGDLIFSGLASTYPGVYGNNAYNASRQYAFNAIPNVRQAEQKLLGVMGRD